MASLIVPTSLCANAEAAEPLPGVDDRRAAAVLATLGEEANELTTASGWSSIVLGGALTATGVLVESKYDASYGAVLWIGGVSALAVGITSLFVRTPIEAFADEVGGSPEGLEARWRAKAEEARSERKTVMYIDAGLGVGGATAASILAAGVGDLSRSERSEWVTLTALLGSAGFAGALYNSLFESSIENGYRLAYPARQAAATVPVRIGASPLPNGGTLQLYGAF